VEEPAAGKPSPPATDVDEQRGTTSLPEEGERSEGAHPDPVAPAEEPSNGATMQPAGTQGEEAPKQGTAPSGSQPKQNSTPADPVAPAAVPAPASAPAAQGEPSAMRPAAE